MKVSGIGVWQCSKITNRWRGGCYWWRIWICWERICCYWDTFSLLELRSCIFGLAKFYETMILDTLSSFSDNIKQRATNPYLGTVAIVWILENWVLVYGLFNFDPDCTLADKTSFIINYFYYYPFWIGMLWCLLKSFGILILTYSLLNASRLIVNMFDKKLTPYIHQISDRSSIVLREIYEEALKNNIELRKRVEEERIEKLKANNDRDELEQKLEALHLKIEEMESQKGGQILENENSEVVITEHHIPESEKQEIASLLNKITQESDHESLRRVITNIDLNKPSYAGKGPTTLFNNGLIKIEKKIASGTSTESTLYSYTKLGIKVIKAYKDKYM
jgi:hypothetical protein